MPKSDDIWVPTWLPKVKKSEKATSWTLSGAAQTLNGRSDLKIRAFWIRPPLQSVVNTSRNRCFSVWHRFHFWLNFDSFLRHLWWPLGPKEQSKLKKGPTKKCWKIVTFLYWKMSLKWVLVVWETRGPYGARWAPEGGKGWSSVPKSCKCDARQKSKMLSGATLPRGLQ